MAMKTPSSPPTARAIALLLLTACATNPVTGKRELNFVSEAQEITMGRQGSAEVIQSIGLVKNDALQQYVSGLGMKIAKASERPTLPWEYHVIDDPVVNAFALPGGFVFVTRGLLGHMMNEAELVTVLGHETGHVTARHSVQQVTRSELAQIGLGVGSILSPTVAKFGDVAGAGLGLMLLKFGRGAETQADELGFKYSLAGGYDVRQMVSVFEMLAKQTELAGGGKLPEWQSTHPDPGNRIAATQQRLAALRENLDGRRVGTEEYLARIDGLMFGENPRLGFFEGPVFLHPDLAFRFAFPDGWKTQNAPDAVVGVSAAGDAMVQLELDKGSAADASRAFFTQSGLTAGTVTRGTIHGFPALSGEFSAATQSGTLRGVATFIEYGGSTYRVLSYTTSEKYATYSQAFQRSAASFDRLTDARALGVQPMRIKVERVPRAMTLTQFQQQFPSVIKLEELALINGVEVTRGLQPGQMIKRVVRP